MTSENTIADKLRRLAKLRAEGIVSDDEYKSLKTKLLEAQLQNHPTKNTSHHKPNVRQSISQRLWGDLPISIARFEQIFLITICLGIGNFFLQLRKGLIPSGGSIWSPLLIIITIFMLILAVSRKRQIWAKWIIIASVVLGTPLAIFQLRDVFSAAPDSGLISIVQTVLQGTAIYLLFQPDAKSYLSLEPAVGTGHASANLGSHIAACTGDKQAGPQPAAAITRTELPSNLVKRAATVVTALGAIAIIWWFTSLDVVGLEASKKRCANNTPCVELLNKGNKDIHLKEITINNRNNKWCRFKPNSTLKMGDQYLFTYNPDDSFVKLIENNPDFQNKEDQKDKAALEFLIVMSGRPCGEIVRLDVSTDRGDVSFSW